MLSAAPHPLAPGPATRVLGLRKPAKPPRAAIAPALAPGYAGAGFLPHF